MNRIAVLCALSVLALATSSCGGGSSFCEDDAAAMTALTNTKLAACPTLKASVGGEANVMPTGAACTTALKSCSTSEQTKLQNSVTCLNALGSCTAAEDELSSGYATSLIACSTNGICATSATCQAAFSMDSICTMLAQ